MKSTCVSTSQRMRPGTTSLLPTARVEHRPQQFQAALEGGADERRADAVRVDRDALVLELGDLRLVEAAGRDDPHARVARGVERVAHLPDEALVHAGRLEVAQLVEERAVD